MRRVELHKYGLGYSRVMQRKIDIVRDLLIKGQDKKALSIASRWARLGAYRDAIKDAQSCQLSPSFYRQIGKDPSETYKKGIEALRKHVRLEENAI